MNTEEAAKLLGDDYYGWLTWVYDSVLDGSLGVNALSDEFLKKGAELAVLFAAQKPNLKGE